MRLIIQHSRKMAQKWLRWKNTIRKLIGRPITKYLLKKYFFFGIYFFFQVFELFSFFVIFWQIFFCKFLIGQNQVGMRYARLGPDNAKNGIFGCTNPTENPKNIKIYESFFGGNKYYFFFVKIKLFLLFICFSWECIKTWEFWVWNLTMEFILISFLQKMSRSY